MAKHVNAWQCIGCGMIEAPQTCIGVCEHHKVQFVYADDHEATVAELERARAELETLRAIVRRLARTTPRGDAWQRSYLALQQQAQRALGHCDPMPLVGAGDARQAPNASD